MLSDHELGRRSLCHLTRVTRAASTTPPHCKQVGRVRASVFSGPIAAMNAMAEGIKMYMSANQTGEKTASTPRPTNQALRKFTQPAHGQLADTLAEQRGQ